ncbi:MAG: dockerin type I repeat-containing protein, partial [Clostridia bacterium]|nr:dockerin type I repeat-containing protein [Clostridia bacterium]
MTGGTICENFAYKKHGTSAVTGGGGGVNINTNGVFVMSGGTICHNYVYNNVGAGFGVAVFGRFEMSNEALITENDVLVAKNRSITLTDRLTSAGTAAVITPAQYTTATVVLTGDKVGVNYRKFEITPQSTTPWYVNSIGALMNTAIVNVASLSKFGAYSVDYVSVAQAVNEVKAGEQGIITIIADNTINETIKVYGDVTILSETDNTYTSMRNGSFTGTLFEVQPGATLRLGFTEAKTWGEDISESGSEFFTLDSVGGKYILDGGYAYNQAQGTSLITVKSGGTLYTYDDFTMQNGCSTTGGNISVSGTMYMYGGDLVNNIGVNGGAINIASTGKVALFGGNITGNNVKSGGFGKAIYNAGTLVRAENIYEYSQDEEIVSTRNTFVNVAEDNDVYLITGKTVQLDKITTTVLLSGTGEAPETVRVSAPTMVITAPMYYAGMPVVTGVDVGIHYTEFEIGEAGYYILPDGTIGYNRLIPDSTSGLKIDREENLISNINTSLTAEDYKYQFLNTEKIEVRDVNGNKMSDSAYLTTGSTISLYNADGTEVIDTVTVVIIGDVDCDGNIDGMDSVYISAIAQGLFENGGLTLAQFRAADVDGSGAGDDTDAQYIQSCGLKINTVDQSVYA